MYGSSAGWPPRKPKRKKLATNNQKKKLKTGRTRGVRIGDRSINGIIKRMRIAPSMATTPPILLGIARRIA
jgi:hypothetical protein